MREMKRFLALGLAAVMLFGIVGCGGGEESSETENTEDKEKPKPRKTEKTKTETLDGYRKKVASWNVK